MLPLREGGDSLLLGLVRGDEHSEFEQALLFVCRRSLAGLELLLCGVFAELREFKVVFRAVRAFPGLFLKEHVALLGRVATEALALTGS